MSTSTAPFHSLTDLEEAPAPTVSRLVWIPQLIAVAILGMTLPFKFSGAEESVRLFDTLGAGAAGRLGTAVMETIAVLMLLTPAFAAGATVAWMRRRQLPVIGSRFH